MRVRRQYLAALFAVTALLSAAPGSRVAAERENGVPAQPDERTIQHVLNRVTFGARPGDLERVTQIGLAKFIDQQLNPEHLSDAAVEARLTEFPTLSMRTSELAEKYYRPAIEARRIAQLQQKAADPSISGGVETKAAPAVTPAVLQARQNEQIVLNDLTQAHLLRAVMSERQLEEVLVDFWFNHFNVFVGKGQVRQYLPEYERDVIRPHVLGSFRDLLGAVAHSPAMLFYLDNWQSSTPGAGPVMPPQVAIRLGDPRTPPAQRQFLLARMQQLQNQRRTRGLNENYGRELMELHTLGVDGGYTQKDVVEVARALTGWTIDRPQQGGGFVFRPEMHDSGEKTILGQHFPAGHGADEGERVLDILVAHPSTAHHIAFQLAQRFVADDPPASLVDRAASTFLKTKGDLRQVVRAIVTSPEFFAPAAYRAKMKTPLEFVVSVARASNAIVVNPQPMAQALRAQLGMPLFGCQPPTGYSNTADAWVNTGALLSRMNFAVQVVGGQTRGIRVDLNAMAPDTSDATRERLLHTLLAGDVSDGTRQVLAKAQTPEQLLALALGSPEFQRR
jgi:uncharacterized protein (DUF1800 family)